MFSRILEAKQKNVKIVLVLINLVEISKDFLILIFISIKLKITETISGQG